MDGELDITIGKNDEEQRYELRVDGELIGLADYYLTGDAGTEVVTIPHTETAPAYRGRGLAGRLVDFVLDDIRAGGRKVRPVCPFVAAHIQQNPQYADLLA